MDHRFYRHRTKAWLGLGSVLLAAAVWQSIETPEAVRGSAPSAGLHQGRADKSRAYGIALEPKRVALQMEAVVPEGPDAVPSRKRFRPPSSTAEDAHADGFPSNAASVQNFGTGHLSDVSVIRTFRVPMVFRLPDAVIRQRFPSTPPDLLETLRKDFEKAVGVGRLSPDDPEYAARWLRAETTAAQRMRTLFGWAAAAEFERQAALEGSP